MKLKESPQVIASLQEAYGALEDLKILADDASAEDGTGQKHEELIIDGMEAILVTLTQVRPLIKSDRVRREVDKTIGHLLPKDCRVLH